MMIPFEVCLFSVNPWEIYILYQFQGRKNSQNQLFLIWKCLSQQNCCQLIVRKNKNIKNFYQYLLKKKQTKNTSMFSEIINLSKNDMAYEFFYSLICSLTKLHTRIYTNNSISTPPHLRLISYAYKNVT